MKHFISYGIVLLIIGFLFVYALLGDDNKNTLVQEMTPETSITHGHGLAVSTDDPNILYIATHHGLLLLKNDTELYRVGESESDFMGFATHPRDARVFYSSGHHEWGGNLGFQTSNDGGFTWEKISDGIDGPVDFHAMAVSPANPNRVYGVHQGKFQISDDGGRSWNAFQPNLPLPIALIPHPNNEDSLYGVTISGVSRSEDGGKTWAQAFPSLSVSGATTLAINPKNAGEIFLFSRSHGLQKTLDEGVTWEKTQEDFGGELVVFLAISPTDPAVVYALTARNEVYKSKDGGISWVKVR